MYFKIINKEKNHRGFQYELGLNVLKEKFNEEGSCVPGGLYFTDVKNIFRFLGYGTYVSKITLPVNDKEFKMVKDPEGDKYRANMIIIENFMPLSDVNTFKYLVEIGCDIHVDHEYALRRASKNGHLEVVKYLVCLLYTSDAADE